MLNRMYYFLKDKLYSASPLFQAARLALTTNSIGTPYALYELPHAQRIEIREDKQSYTLTGHHLSFYEQEAKSDAKFSLSQYHYTAYFTDTQKQQYQLHVHFNNNDQALATVFSRKAGDSTYSREPLSPALENNFLQLAIDKSQALMAEIRKQHQDAVDTLAKRYKSLEKRARELSLNRKQQRDEYLACLGQVIEVLQLLAPHDDIYSASLKMAKRICSLAQLSAEQPAVPDEDTADLTEATVTETESPGKKQENQNLPRPSLRMSLQAANAAYRAFQAVTEARASFKEQQLPTLLKFIEKTQDALILSEEKYSHLQTEQLYQIQNLLSESREQAIKMLTRLLLDKEFDANDASIFALRNYFSHLPNMFVSMAIKTGNAPLLDFLLTHGDFAINTLLVDKQAPVLFCFSTHKANPKKSAACLSVLIKHNASVLIPADDGLPVAYHVMSDCVHPLKSAFTDNADKTVGNRHFLTTFTACVDRCLNQGDFTELTKSQIAAKAQACEAQFLLASNLESSATTKLVTHVNENRVASLASHYSKEWLQDLQEDKEFVTKRTALITLSDLYFSYLTPAEKREQSLLVQERLKKLDEQMQNRGDLSETELQGVKQQVLQQLDNTMRRMKLHLELLDVQRELKSVPVGKASRQTERGINSAVQREKEISEELKGLDPTLPAFNQAQFQKEMLSSTGSMFDTLKKYGIIPGKNEMLTITVKKENGSPVMTFGVKEKTPLWSDFNPNEEELDQIIEDAENTWKAHLEKTEAQQCAQLYSRLQQVQQDPSAGSLIDETAAAFSAAYYGKGH